MVGRYNAVCIYVVVALLPDVPCGKYNYIGNYSRIKCGRIFNRKAKIRFAHAHFQNHVMQFKGHA